MAIFGKSSSPKNQVYLRRKSLRLANIALWSACTSGLLIGCYLFLNKNEELESEVDEISTSTLTLHEPIKYFYHKYINPLSQNYQKTNDIA
jgi:hypothetical protein